MKAINLIALDQAISNLNEDNRSNYLAYLGINVRLVEADGIKKLISCFKANKANYDLYDDFYFGYTIPQIGKEFDLLRFGQKTVINVELKSEFNEEKIVAQLELNAYYLSFLSLKVYQFTFDSSSSKLYKLDSEGKLIETSINELLEHLEGQEVNENLNLDTTFNPSNYLVSPFNSTSKFINDEYFLTKHQDIIKKEIVETFGSTNAEFFSICGKAGTGKTLLTYDIAKFFIDRMSKVIVTHCGKLNHGHYELRSTYGWDIISIKQYEKILESSFDVLILVKYKEYDLFNFIVS